MASSCPYCLRPRSVTPEVGYCWVRDRGDCKRATVARAEKAEAERDALQARLAELEAQAEAIIAAPGKE